mmetsp:Transcript_84040/g.246534  ORF Transcript_84040/g.246534 Transcript_84040/m.246534 type:complete len:249 (-) Transcript_84040:98-844(-)
MLSSKLSKPSGVVALSSAFATSSQEAMSFAWVGLPVQLSSVAEWLLKHLMHLLPANTQLLLIPEAHVMRISAHPTMQLLASAACFSSHVEQRRTGIASSALYFIISSSHSFWLCVKAGIASDISHTANAASSSGNRPITLIGLARLGKISTAMSGRTLNAKYSCMSDVFISGGDMRTSLLFSRWSDAGRSCCVLLRSESKVLNACAQMALMGSIWLVRAVLIASMLWFRSLTTDRGSYFLAGFQTWIR